MDIYCCKCGEPVELDYIHDVVADRIAAGDTAATYSIVAAEFRRTGCPAIGGSCNTDTVAHPAVSAMYDLLGDDMDGAAAMMEDMDMMSGGPEW